MIKFKVHIWNEDKQKTLPHLCTVDCFVIRDNVVFVNIQQPNLAGILSVELPKKESLNIITLLKM